MTLVLGWVGGSVSSKAEPFFKASSNQPPQGQNASLRASSTRMWVCRVFELGIEISVTFG